MKIRFESRTEFIVHGYAVETILSSCENDVGQLWEKHKESLLSIPESKSCLYGVMWYTENHRYYYHLGILSDISHKNDMTAVTIPAAYFAIATVPDNMDAIEAWTQYFEKELPSLGYVPNVEHGKYFEFYNADGACELWTPVKKQTH
ncbi:MAG: effector binding domain-containing protein [Oscillospiraceae bacterium]|nr:effector binding domain-containing protein [Oscillospiraceae bacterium]